ncbi:MAG: hypothetical protein HYS09_02710 [Chloroflexi bacterium]|nr:hypothetical protein [Chloroflexota bacterium]
MEQSLQAVVDTEAETEWQAQDMGHKDILEKVPQVRPHSSEIPTEMAAGVAEYKPVEAPGAEEADMLLQAATVPESVVQVGHTGWVERRQERQIWQQWYSAVVEEGARRILIRILPEQAVQGEE